jgi:hypothetical protein
MPFRTRTDGHGLPSPPASDHTVVFAAAATRQPMEVSAFSLQPRYDACPHLCCQTKIQTVLTGFRALPNLMLGVTGARASQQSSIQSTSEPPTDLAK